MEVLIYQNSGRPEPRTCLMTHPYLEYHGVLPPLFFVVAAQLVAQLDLEMVQKDFW